MTLNELVAEYEQRRPHDPENDFAGSLTQADIDELKEWDP